MKLTAQIIKNDELIKYLETLQKNLIEIKDKGIAWKEIINPYPEYINERKLWPLMGTYTDYMIRKMISVNYKNTISERLIAEISLNKLRTSDLDEPVKQSYVDLPSWIIDYKDNSISWEDIIEQCFYISQTDSLYRSGQMRKRIEFPIKEKKEFLKFFQNINNYLVNLELSGEILLNPKLGIPHCPADADLIDDDAIYDIKTSKIKPVKKDILQLLGYLALYYHKTKKKANYIGIFNPLYLSMKKFNCEKVTEKELDDIIKLLSNF